MGSPDRRTFKRAEDVSLQKRNPPAWCTACRGRSWKPASRTALRHSARWRPASARWFDSLEMAKIMVVDDSGYARRVHRGILERAGHSVIEASSGTGAIES